MAVTDEIMEAIESVADEVGGTVRRGYSGRGMYGLSCVGIVCDDAVACVEAAARQGVVGAKIDSMGTGEIVYWPRLLDLPRA